MSIKGGFVRWSAILHQSTEVNTFSFSSSSLPFLFRCFKYPILQSSLISIIAKIHFSSIFIQCFTNDTHFCCFPFWSPKVFLKYCFLLYSVVVDVVLNIPPLWGLDQVLCQYNCPRCWIIFSANLINWWWLWQQYLYCFSKLVEN